MTTVDIQLRKVNKVYSEGDLLVGDVILNAKTEYQHQGITLAVDGVVRLQLGSRKIGIFDAFNNSVKPIQLLFYSSEISRPGKLSPGKTEIPFQVALAPKSGKYLYETYHGAFINIKYMITAELKRSLLNKDVQKQCEFLIEYKNQKEKAEVVPVAFTLSSDTWTVANENEPKIKIVGKLESSNMRMSDPLTGEIVIEQCDMAIRTVDIQLVRVEMCGDAAAYTKDVTEVQTIQICDGDVSRHLPIPIYMVFPRLFACPTLATNNFKVDFEVNLVFMFCNGRHLTRNIPITLTR